MERGIVFLYFARINRHSVCLPGGIVLIIYPVLNNNNQAVKLSWTAWNCV